MTAKKKVKRSSIAPRKKRNNRVMEFRATRASHAPRPVSAKVENLLVQELEKGKEELFPKGSGFMFWFKRYSPVIVTQFVALMTYFYMVFYMFYPEIIVRGNYMHLLIMLVFVFLLAGLFLYLGLRSEQIFIRILSFIFVFIIFTFLLLFILLAYALKSGMFA